MHVSKLVLPVALTLSALTLAAPPSAEAQGFMDRVKKRAEEAAKRKVEQRVEQRSGEATDAALDRAERGAKCAATDQKCLEAARAEGKTAPAGEGTGGGTAGASAGVFVNFDFVPGERVLFAEAFANDAVGDFPRRLELVKGNMEVIEYQGRRFLRTGADEATLAIPLPEVLPARFTIEFDYLGATGNNLDMYFTGSSDAYYREGKGRVHVVTHAGGVSTYNGPSSVGEPREALAGKVFPVRIMADERYVKVYMGGTRVANAPNIDLGRGRKIMIRVPGNSEPGSLIGNIRIAAGGKDLYDALTEKGRVATQGIFFDTGSDRIRPESAPTLKQIGEMLTAHADLRLRIEGHTDDVGDAAANQQLSERRAAAVKAHLVAQFKLDAARLEAQGLGESKPAASNATPEGRQQNRRVELVKL